MSNYLEYNDKIAFHPGYYIKEIIDESGLTQEDFAKRLDTTPKNLSLLIRGEQSLSIDIAMKMSRMIGTTVNYWLNLQSAYDALIAEFKSEEELVKEREVFKALNYKYFRDYYGLPDLPRKIDEQIKEVRESLKVSTLSVLKNADMAVCFRSASNQLTDANIIRSNAMVQIAINKAMKIEAPKYNKQKFEEAIEYALTLTSNHEGFYPLIKQAFSDAGVIFVMLPNLEGSKTNGATKKIGNNIMLMVNDRRGYADTFWFTLFHEIGHIVNGDFGISFDTESGELEDAANKYARDRLIPSEQYDRFLKAGRFDKQAIKNFANKIHRDPGIILGRLQSDEIIDHGDWTMNELRHKYVVKGKGSRSI